VVDNARNNHLFVYEVQFGAKDDVVAVLKSAQETLSPEANEALIRVLASADERIAKGDLFSEAGRTIPGGDQGGDAWAKIEKAAADLVEKSDDGMTQAQHSELASVVDAWWSDFGPRQLPTPLRFSLKQHAQTSVAGIGVDPDEILIDAALVLMGLDQGAMSVFGDDMHVHEFLHDARHLLGFPCH
jgi:hypothetical protein